MAEWLSGIDWYAGRQAVVRTHVVVEPLRLQLPIIMEAAPSWMSWSMLGMSAAALFVGIGSTMLYAASCFARSEVDLQLARLGRFKDKHFAGKVRWQSILVGRCELRRVGDRVDRLFSFGLVSFRFVSFPGHLAYRRFTRPG